MACRSAQAALALLLFGCADRTASLNDEPRSQPSVLSDPKLPEVTPTNDPTVPVLEPVAGERCEDPTTSCALCASSSLDLDFTLRSAEISGFVNLFGRLGLDPTRYGWGTEIWLLFTDTRTDHIYRALLNSSGEYQIHLFHGEYNVEIQATDPQRRQAVTLASLGLHNFQADGSLNHQFSVREIHGEITLDAETMPPDRSDGRVTRGWIRFVDQETGTQLNVRLPSQGPATYTAILPTDRAYDVVWITSGFEDQTPHLEDPLPPSAGVISELLPGETGVVNFDVQTIEISGEITANGLTFPNDGILDGAPRAVLEFSPTKFGSVSRVSLGEQGPGRFNVKLIPGDYAVQLLTGSSNQQNALKSSTRWSLCEAPKSVCAFQKSSTLNISVPEGVLVGDPPPVPETAVEGQVALLGPWEDIQADLSGAEIVFLSRDTNVEVRAQLLEDGRFSIQVPEGPYELHLRGRHGRSPWGYASASKAGSTPIPLMGVTVLGDRVLIRGEAQTLNLSAEAIHLTGEILINHELMNSNGQFGDRGRLELSVTSDDEAYPRFRKIHLFFGEEGPASWSVLIMRNRYTARLSTFDSSRGIHPLSQDVLPVGELSLGTLDLSVERSLTRSVMYDVGVHSLRGTVQVEGALPSVDAQDLSVRFVNDAGGEEFSAELTASGEPFEVLVFAGEYKASLVSGRWDASPPFGRTSLLRACEVR